MCRFSEELHLTVIVRVILAPRTTVASVTLHVKEEKKQRENLVCSQRPVGQAFAGASSQYLEQKSSERHTAALEAFPA